MLTLSGISLGFGSRQLFREIAVTINPRDRIGLVGNNGTGKSTLLRILAGEQLPDAGELQKSSQVSIGYLPQEMPGASGRSVLEEVENAFPEIVKLRSRLEQLNDELLNVPDGVAPPSALIEAIGGIEHELEAHDAHSLGARVLKVLHGLGFEDQDHGRDCCEFSGGWQMRILLAKLLLQRPSLLLLDEPTNHLDMDSIRWLERYLASYEGAVMLVSHDQAFLDALTNRTFALGGGRLDVYSGNYSYFETQSAERKRQERMAANNQARQIEQTERFIERFRAKATKARQVQSRIKALDKIERIEIEEDDDAVAFSFPPASRSGQSVAELKDVHKAYGDLSVLEGLDLRIERGDRLAIVGVNGAGKSTIARILAGVEPFQSGTRSLGQNVELSFFAQHQAQSLDPNLTVLEEAESAAPIGQGRRVRHLLGAFLFRGDDVHKSIRVLSGGERNRLALAKMLLRPFNFLILDEPTNHLDLRSKRVLQQAIRQFDGTLVLVSHDRQFLDPLVSRVLEVGKRTARVLHGNISDYLGKIDAERALQPKLENRSSEVTVKPENQRERRRRRADSARQLRPLKRKVEEVESRLARLEGELHSMEAAMMDPAFFKRGEATRADMEKADRLKNKIQQAYEDWETASEALECAAAEN